MLLASFYLQERRTSPASMFATYGLGHFLERDEATDEYVEVNFAFKSRIFFFLLPEKWSTAGCWFAKEGNTNCLYSSNIQ